MTVPNCLGCWEDFCAAIEYGDEGLTIVPHNFGSKGHFSFVAIDDNNKVVVWAGTGYDLGDIL